MKESYPINVLKYYKMKNTTTLICLYDSVYTALEKSLVTNIYIALAININCLFATGN